MRRAVFCFWVGETGAVTVDWVVLTAVVSGFGVIVMLSLGSGTEDIAASMQVSLSAVDVAPLPELGYGQ